VFNIGADTPYTINQLAEVVSRAMKKPLNKIHLDSRNEVMHAYADHEKAKKVFNYEPKYDLEYGVKRQVEWALEVGSKKSADFSNIEIEKNLPSSWRS
jgi:UDP-glucose 4-epimerase